MIRRARLSTFELLPQDERPARSCLFLANAFMTLAAYSEVDSSFWTEWLQLQVRTYDVVPVSSSLGLVEFVPGTQPLKNAIMAFIEPEVCLKPLSLDSHMKRSNSMADVREQGSYSCS